MRITWNNLFYTILFIHVKYDAFVGFTKNYLTQQAVGRFIKYKYKKQNLLSLATATPQYVGNDEVIKITNNNNMRNYF